MSPAGTQHAGLIGVADAQVGDGEREDGAALLGPVETWSAGELDDLAAGKEVHATRGAKITSWREAERVLAGFDDGLTDQGPTAGPASLVGLQIAHDKNWTAPAPAAPAPAPAKAEEQK